jgi:hypothetical protein
MHAEALREVAVKLPFAGYSVVRSTSGVERALFVVKIAWDDPPTRLWRSGGQAPRNYTLAASAASWRNVAGLSVLAREASGGGTPGSKVPGYRPEQVCRWS